MRRKGGHKETHKRRMRGEQRRKGHKWKGMKEKRDEINIK